MQNIIHLIPLNKNSYSGRLFQLKQFIKQSNKIFEHKIFYLKSLDFFKCFNYLLLSKFFHKKKTKIVVLHSWSSLHLIFAYLSKIFQIKVFFWTSAYGYDYPKDLLKKFKKKMIINTLDTIVCCGHFKNEDLNLNNKKIKIRQRPNLLGFHFNFPIHKKDNNERALYVGAICKRKNQIKIIDHCLENEIKIDFYGPINNAFENEKKYTDIFFNKCKKNFRLVSYKGLISWDLRKKTYEKYKYFFVASKYEGLNPNFYFEALSLGLTPIFINGSDLNWYDDLKSNGYLDKENIITYKFYSEYSYTNSINNIIDIF